MKNLFEYLRNEQYNYIINENYCHLIAEDIINESFKSSLLLALAKKIKDIESNTAKEDKERIKVYKERGWSSNPPQNAKSFSSIFAPIVQSFRFGSSKLLQGVKWSEISDSDFVKYTDINDKEFKKVFKSIYNHDESACVICCEPNSQNIKYFIQCYSKDLKIDNKFYIFDTENRWGNTVREKTAPKGKYNERSLNMKEVLPLIDGLDIYILHITDNLKQEYKSLTTDRKESQKGVINYDEESLKNLLKEQKARYKALAEKMKALNLRANSEQFFDDIVQTNNEIIELYKKITTNPKYMDMAFDLGDLMQYMSYVYQEYYHSMKYSREADKEAEAYPEYGGTYSRAQADSAINDSKSYLKNVKEKIQAIKTKLT